MIRVLFSLAACLLLAAPAVAQPPLVLPKLKPEEIKLLAPYMTPDFQLTAALEVHDELTGFGTFFGTVWRIEPDGAWTITRILAKQTLVIGQGRISKVKIYELAKKLAIADPLSLPNIGTPVVNPHVVTIFFGPKASALTFGVDEKLTPTKLSDLAQPVTPYGPYVTGKNVPVGVAIPPLSPLTRYAAIQWAMRDMIQPNLGVDLVLPERLKQLMQPY
jgi:hypothetical protein